MHGTTYIKKKT